MTDRFSTINVSTLSFLKILVIVALVVFLYLIRDVLAILFVSLIFASALSPAVGAMERHGIPRGFGIISIYLFILFIISAVIFLIIPPLTIEYEHLVTRAPELADRFASKIQDVMPGLNITLELKKYVQTFQSNLVEFAGGVFIKIVDLLKGLIAFFLIFVVTFYMIVEETSLKKALHTVIPLRYRGYIDELMTKAQKKIGMWLRGQLILCCIIFALAFLSLSILGVQYALILAIIAGLTEFMPIIGPVMGAIPAIFVAFNQAPLLAIWVILLYTAIQYIENHILVPRVMQFTIGLNPLLSVVALLVGAQIAGIAGILLAIPIVTVLSVIVNEFIDEESTRPAPSSA